MIFTNEMPTFSHGQLYQTGEFLENHERSLVPKPGDSTTAPNWLHPPVNYLHSIEKSEDTILEF
jgi:hypothetical protein